jgi:hypothetical protein
LRKLTRTIRGSERQLETIRDLFQTVFDGNAGHGENSFFV